MAIWFFRIINGEDGCLNDLEILEGNVIDNGDDEEVIIIEN